jgi:hypothetical protein
MNVVSVQLTGGPPLRFIAKTNESISIKFWYWWCAHEAVGEYNFVS